MLYDREEIISTLTSQLRMIFNYKMDVSPYIDGALEHVGKVFEVYRGKYFREKFDPYNTVQNCIFLYWLSRTMYEIDKSGEYAEKIYYLNKVLNSVELFYEVELPDIWACEHPLGSVMGKARYSDRFLFLQGCTVGGNKGCYPQLGFNVTMYSNSKILGNCIIGNNVLLSANSYVKDMNIPDNSIVFGQYPDITIKERPQAEIEDLTARMWGGIPGESVHMS